jgi:hypothetical protein
MTSFGGLRDESGTPLVIERDAILVNRVENLRICVDVYLRHRQDSRVTHHDLCRREEMSRSQGEQIRISGPSSNEGDCPHGRLASIA